MVEWFCHSAVFEVLPHLLHSLLTHLPFQIFTIALVLALAIPSIQQLASGKTVTRLVLRNSEEICN